MADSMKQPRAENGHFVSLGTLFERERVGHSKDHDRERAIAEETAKRLERAVELTAKRIEDAVGIALMAVAETARIHAEAHKQQHEAHERIHSVEKGQLDKADDVRQREAERLKEQLSEFKSASNEWRGALRDQAGTYVTRQVFETEHERIIAIEKKLAYYAGAAGAIGVLVSLVLRLSGH